MDPAALTTLTGAKVLLLPASVEGGTSVGCNRGSGLARSASTENSSQGSASEQEHEGQNQPIMSRSPSSHEQSMSGGLETVGAAKALQQQLGCAIQHSPPNPGVPGPRKRSMEGADPDLGKRLCQGYIPKVSAASGFGGLINGRWGGPLLGCRSSGRAGFQVGLSQTVNVRAAGLRAAQAPVLLPAVSKQLLRSWPVQRAESQPRATAGPARMTVWQSNKTASSRCMHAPQPQLYALCSPSPACLPLPAPCLQASGSHDEQPADAAAAGAAGLQLSSASGGSTGHGQSQSQPACNNPPGQVALLALHHQGQQPAAFQLMGGGHHLQLGTHGSNLQAGSLGGSLALALARVAAASQQQGGHAVTTDGGAAGGAGDSGAPAGACVAVTPTANQGRSSLDYAAAPASHTGATNASSASAATTQRAAWGSSPSHQSAAAGQGLLVPPGAQAAAAAAAPHAAAVAAAGAQLLHQHQQLLLGQLQSQPHSGVAHCSSGCGEDEDGRQPHSATATAQNHASSGSPPHHSTDEEGPAMHGAMHGQMALGLARAASAHVGHHSGATYQVMEAPRRAVSDASLPPTAHAITSAAASLYAHGPQMGLAPQPAAVAAAHPLLSLLAAVGGGGGGGLLGAHAQAQQVPQQQPLQQPQQQQVPMAAGLQVAAANQLLLLQLAAGQQPSREQLLAMLGFDPAALAAAAGAQAQAQAAQQHKPQLQLVIGGAGGAAASAPGAAMVQGVGGIRYVVHQAPAGHQQHQLLHQHSLTQQQLQQHDQHLQLLHAQQQQQQMQQMQLGAQPRQGAGGRYPRGGRGSAEGEDEYDDQDDEEVRG